jgi:hypothetical protein
MSADPKPKAAAKDKAGAATTSIAAPAPPAAAPVSKPPAPAVAESGAKPQEVETPVSDLLSFDFDGSVEASSASSTTASSGGGKMKAAVVKQEKQAGQCLGCAEDACPKFVFCKKHKSGYDSMYNDAYPKGKKAKPNPEGARHFQEIFADAATGRIRLDSTFAVAAVVDFTASFPQGKSGVKRGPADWQKYTRSPLHFHLKHTSWNRVCEGGRTSCLLSRDD